MTIAQVLRFSSLILEHSRRADKTKHQWHPLSVIPTVYPKALGAPVLKGLTADEIRACKDIAEYYPALEIFFLGVNDELKDPKWGIKNGEVYVNGSFVRKLVSEKKRFKMDDVLPHLALIVKNASNFKIDYPTKQGNPQTHLKPVLYGWSSVDGIIYRVIIAREGKMPNCLISVFRENKSPR